MNRRDFLKVCVLTAGAVALPTKAAALLLAPEGPVPAGYEETGLVREVFAYDIDWDLMHLRHDILTDAGQFHVDQAITSAEYKDDSTLLEARRRAVLLLGDKLRFIGKNWRDVKCLPLPDCVHSATHFGGAALDS